MLPQFDRDVFDTSPDKIAEVDSLHIPDLSLRGVEKQIHES